MPKTFNYKDSVNMVTAVSTSYVKREEIFEYFESNFNKDKKFTADELKQIVRDLTTGKERITQTMDEIGIPLTSTEAKRKYYKSFIEDDNEYDER